MFGRLHLANLHYCRRVRPKRLLESCCRPLDGCVASSSSTTEPLAAAAETTTLGNSSNNHTSLQPQRQPGKRRLELWQDPWYYANKQHLKPPEEFSGVRIAQGVDWSYVRRLYPVDVIPDVPKHDKYPTASGWSPPQDPPPDLPYYVARTRLHTFPLFLECRRDQLDPETMEFDYVELIVMKNIEGDIYACERDVRAYLERRLGDGKTVATHVNELQGCIRVNGVDRSLVEQFLGESGF